MTNMNIKDLLMVGYTPEKLAEMLDQEIKEAQIQIAADKEKAEARKAALETSREELVDSIMIYMEDLGILTYNEKYEEEYKKLQQAINEVFKDFEKEYKGVLTAKNKFKNLDVNIFDPLFSTEKKETPKKKAATATKEKSADDVLADFLRILR